MSGIKEIKNWLSQVVQPTRVTITRRPYELEQELEIFIHIGSILNRGEYIVDGNNNEQIFLLIDYANGGNLLDTSKGILLRGTIGSGKTLLMKILSRYSHFICKGTGYRIIPARELSAIYLQEGYIGLRPYLHNSGSPVSLCIDDAGLEPTESKYYGTSINIAHEILLTRYDLYIERRILTHITTNLTPQKLQEIYGERVRSRLMEMVNDVVICGKDRRKTNA